jgi:FkbM family methyltransferase
MLNVIARARHLKDELAVNARYFGHLFNLKNIGLFLPNSQCTITVPGYGTIRVRRHNSDMAVVRQIFGAREYDLMRFGQYPRIRAAYDAMISEGITPIIVDAGAYIGLSSIFFAAAFPEATVLAIEPDSENVGLCRINTSSRANIRVVQAALGGQSGSATFVSTADPQSWAFQIVRSEDGSVPLATISDLLSEQGPNAGLFLVKIDIEGFERDVFGNSEPWIDQSAVTFIEIHDWLFPGEHTSRNLFQDMAKRECEVLISGENLVFVR